MLLDYTILRPLQTHWGMINTQGILKFSLLLAGHAGVELLLTGVAASPTMHRCPICGPRHTMPSEGWRWHNLIHEDRKPVPYLTHVSASWECCCETPLNWNHLPGEHKGKGNSASYHRTIRQQEPYRICHHWAQCSCIPVRPLLCPPEGFSEQLPLALLPHTPVPRATMPSKGSGKHCG